MRRLGWLWLAAKLTSALVIGLLLPRISEAIVGLDQTATDQPTDSRPVEPTQREDGPDGSTRTDRPATPRYAKGQLIVKYKDSVTECVHCLLKAKKPFRQATSDQSDSLDRLHAKYQVKAAKAIFRTEEEEEAQVPGQKTIVVLKQHQVKKLEDVARRFPKRAARGPKGAVTPDLSHVYLLDIAEGADVQAAAAEFARNAHVEYAHPNYLVDAAFSPNDPYYTSCNSWNQGCPPTGYDDLWGLKKIQTGSAWDVTKGESILVAVVDTGFDYTHPDLSANVWVNPCEDLNHNGQVDPSDLNGVDDACPGFPANGFIDDVRGWDATTCARFGQGEACLTPKAQGNDPMDQFGHGTHVAGTIAALGNNGIGVIGVAPGAKVMAVKGLNDEGTGSSVDLAAAIRYAADNGADVVNNSWGCQFCPSVQVTEDALQYAHSVGAVVVFAAGNESDDVAVRSPQNQPYAVVVSASHPVDGKAPFSSGGLKVDVAAPGGGETQFEATILSLSVSGSVLERQVPGNVVSPGYLRLSGTSMATPHVSGLTALILANRPTLTNEQVRQVLRMSADQPAGWNSEAGRGRINATTALTLSTTLEVLIRQPRGMTNLNSLQQVDVIGTAQGPGFASYQLSYGAGLPPVEWIPIRGGASPVANDWLGTWDVRSFRANYYTLKLEATATTGATYDMYLPFFKEDARPLVTLPSVQRSPAVSGHRVVWEDDRNGNWDIYLYDFRTQTERQITTDPAIQAGPAIYGNTIVWEDYRNGTPDIYRYDLATSAESPVTTHSANQGWPAIDGNNIVWVDQRYDTADIFRYDLATATEQRLTTNVLSSLMPDISGHRIVYEDSRTGYREIWLYNLATNTEEQITNRRLSVGGPALPTISRDKIVWQQGLGLNQDVYLYDLGNRTERPIAAGRGAQTRPDLSGNRIVWEHRADGLTNSDVRAFDLGINTTQVLTFDVGHQLSPAIDGGLVVWVDRRNGNDDLYYTFLDGAPIMNPVADRTINEGDQLSITLTAFDPDGESLTYTTSSLPRGAIFTDRRDGTALFTWTPDNTQGGPTPPVAGTKTNYSITFTVTDPGGLSASQTVTITVLDKCHILTAAFGRPDHPAIQALWQAHQRLVGRQWDSPWHRTYLAWYDAHGPQVAAFIQNKPMLKALVRAVFTPLARVAAWRMARAGGEAAMERR